MKKYWIELVAIVVFVMIGVLQPCKYIFECSKYKDLCEINNRNIIGISMYKNAFRLSDIKDVNVNKYIKSEIRGGRYTHHTEDVECYDINFVMKDGEIIENALNNCIRFDMIAFKKAKEITEFLNTPDSNDYKIMEDCSLLEFIWFGIASALALCIFFKYLKEK